MTENLEKAATDAALEQAEDGTAFDETMETRTEMIDVTMPRYMWAPMDSFLTITNTKLAVFLGDLLAVLLVKFYAEVLQKVVNTKTKDGEGHENPEAGDQGAAG